MTITENKPATTRENRILKLSRVFDAPRHTVFEAWTKKEHVDQWCAPYGFSIPFSEGDVRPGGAWRSTMRSSDGTEYHLGGIYREVEQDELLVFTQKWDDGGEETTVTVRFADQGDGRTLVNFEQGEFETTERRDSHEGGWDECMDRLGDYLKGMRGTPKQK